MKYYITCVQKRISPSGIYEDEERLRELVVCKDCKYYTGKWCTKFSTKQFDINDICKADDDFCSMAERKEE